jgi:hypothetical protein
MILGHIKVEELNNILCWEFLMHESVTFGKLYKNPFRVDKKPGCKFFRSGNVILFHDHSRGKTYNVITACSIIYNLSYREASELLLNQIQSGVVMKVKPAETQVTCGIEVVSKKYTKEFINYWENLGVTVSNLERLETRVLQVESYKITSGVTKTYYLADLVFAYQGQKGYKLYFPEREKPRFKSSLDKEDVWEVINNPKKWIITKSHKDMLVIESLLEDTDFSFSHVQNEGSFPKRDYWEDAWELYILMDNDKAGHIAAERMKDYYLNANIIFLSAKDASDLVKEKGVEFARNELIKCTQS